MKSFSRLSNESIPSNCGRIRSQKVISDDTDLTYNPEFIEEMNEIKKEKSINITKYKDLFDDE